MGNHPHGVELGAFLDGELEGPARARVAAHLERCEACRRQAARALRLQARVHQLVRADRPPAPPALREALRRLGAPPPGARRVLRGWRVAAAAGGLALAAAAAGEGLPHVHLAPGTLAWHRASDHPPDEPEAGPPPAPPPARPAVHRTRERFPEAPR